MAYIKEDLLQIKEELNQLQIQLTKSSNNNYILNIPPFIDNCTLESTTPYELQFQIKDPNIYEKVHLDELKKGIRYRYCFTKGTYPECITIISNEGDELIITNPFHYGKEWNIKKSEVKQDKDIFYKKVIIHSG